MPFSRVSLPVFVCDSPPPPRPSCPLSLSHFIFFCPSGAGQQQEAGQAEVNRGEPGAPSERGAAEDGVGPNGAHPGGVGPHPYGDRGPYGHERPGQPLEAEAEVPGETPSPYPSLPHSLLTTAIIVLITLALSSPTHPSQTPVHTLPLVSTTSASTTTTVPLFPVLICPCVFLVSPCRVGRISWTMEKSVFLNASAIIYNGTSCLFRALTI